MQENKGRANREVVQKLINDMNDFSEFVKNELLVIVDQTERLSESWNDPQYDQFSSFIRELTSSLNKDLLVFDESSLSLQKKLDMYD